MDSNIQCKKCKKCGKMLSSVQNLEKHMNKKIPCDSIIKCHKCDRIFKTKQLLLSHQKRKTPCEHIVGDPTERTPKNACRFCGRQLSSKQSLNNHYNTCKIKNGGMMLLFEKVKKLEEKVKTQENELKTLRTAPQGQLVSGNNNNFGKIEASIDLSNHNNTQININFINWDDNSESIKKILAENLPRILSAPKQDDIPFVQQLTKRMSHIVGMVFRNPEYKELQGMYVVDISKETNNAFIYNDDKWVITDWNELRTNMLQKLYNCKPKNKQCEEDVLDIIKYLFVLGKCGDCKSIKRLSEEETLRLYSEISQQLDFSKIKKK